MKIGKQIGFIMFGIIFFLVLGIIVYSVRENEKILNQVSTYFENKESIAASGDIVSKQQEADQKILSVMNDASCTFNDPCVLVNPYDISPLTALIIYETSEEVETKVYINDVFVTTMEISKKHAIPIYGLRAGQVNRILLKEGNLEKELTIDLSGISKNNLMVEVQNPNAMLQDDVYFLSAPMGASAAAYDGSGQLIWYLTPNYSLDMEFLENGHMYLSNNNASGLQYTYDGFLEIDYLGKIYRDYSLKNGYHHELISLSDGTILVAGGSDDANAPYQAAFVYQIDSETGEILDSFDLYDIFSSIDVSFADSLKGVNMINNSIYYDEETGEMVLSFRGINSIIDLNFKTKKLNWIFGDPLFYPDSFQPYLLNVVDHSRLPKGQHTAFLTSDGYLGVFNNDYDVLDTTTPDLLYYGANYSSATLYQIQDKNISTYWDFDGNGTYFNYALGSFQYYPNGTKLIDFGWTYKQAAYVPGNTIYDYLGNTYARIMELDNNNQVVFNATIEEGVYRAFKHSFYQEKTAHYTISSYQLIDNNPVTDLEEIETKSIFEFLTNAIPNPFDFELSKNSIHINVIFDNSEFVDIYFVSEEEHSLIYHYKKENEVLSPKINLHLDGNYAIYLKINDQFYDTGKILSF